MTPDVVVIGLGCRLPGADNPEQMWQDVVSGRALFETVSAEEAEGWGWDASLRSRVDYLPVRASLTGVDEFDAEFFHVSRRDAILMDPQQRVFLETVQMALDDARVELPAPSRVGVFSSCSASTYLLGPLARAGLWNDHNIDYSALLGCDKDFLSSRVSYLMDLRGPSVVIQTACSSSLTAVHVARASLVLGGCDLAIVGGSSISLPHLGGYLATRESIFSPTGVCRPFDAGADGTVKGNGVAAIVLARRDDVDPGVVYASVAGSATNNDGADKAGYPAPGIAGQSGVIALAQREALSSGSLPELAYVETHGTGTRLGDPIEVRALREGLDQAGLTDIPVWLGSAKANFGHLDAAAGIVSLIKACLVIQHGVVPPMAGFSQPNPLIDFGAASIPTAAVPLTSASIAVGVSSFGMGGSNTHIVLAGEQATAPRDHQLRSFCRTSFWPDLPAPMPRRSSPGESLAPVPMAPGLVGVDDILRLAREALLDPTLEADDNVFDRAGDSLAIVTLLGDLETVGIRLDFSDVQQAPTVRLLSGLVAGLPPATPGIADLLPPEEHGRATSSGELARQPSCLISLRQGPPQLFLVHPAGGTTACYVDLAKKLPWGIAALNFPPSLTGSGPSIRDLAALYLDAIQERRQPGRLWLAGWSFGGNMAAEMVLQAGRRGWGEVGLIMIDSHPPRAYIGGHCDADDYLRAFPTLLTQLFPHVVLDPPDRPARTVSEILSSVKYPHWPASVTAQLEQFYSIWIDNHTALKRWLPDQVITAPTLIVEATKPEPAQILDHLGLQVTSVHEWDDYLSCSPVYCPARGNHYDIVREPDGVSDIASAILPFIQETS